MLTHRFLALDALRGICALLVCLFHFRVNSPVFFHQFIRESWIFVDFFFVLSGFVIALNYRDRLITGFPIRNFVGLRFFRLYPLHLAILLAMLIFELLGTFLFSNIMSRQAFSGFFTIEDFILNLFFLQSFGLGESLSWNAPSWSIATEFWTYILFALLLVAARQKTEAVLIAVVLVCLPILLAVSPHGINVTWDWGMVRCIFGFAIGALCYDAWQRWHKRLPILSTAGWTLIEALTVAGVVAAILLLADIRANLLLPFVFAAGVFVFAREGGAISMALKVKPMLFLGTLSYSIYMIHILVQARLEDAVRFIGIERFQAVLLPTLDYGLLRASGNPDDGLLLTFVMLALVILSSTVTYHLIEAPGNRWGRKLFGAPKAAAAA